MNRSLVLADWRTVADDKEKYQAYLCSRECGELRAAVHERAGGKCERCGWLPIQNVHHLTYSRKYREELTDLQGVCRQCHEFNHGLSNENPAGDEYRRVVHYIQGLGDRSACPLVSLQCPNSIPLEFSFVCDAIAQLYVWAERLDATHADYCPIELATIAERIQEDLPFDYAGLLFWSIGRAAHGVYERALQWAGVDCYVFD